MTDKFEETLATSIIKAMNAALAKGPRKGPRNVHQVCKLYRERIRLLETGDFEYRVLSWVSWTFDHKGSEIMMFRSNEKGEITDFEDLDCLRNEAIPEEAFRVMMERHNLEFVRDLPSNF